MLTVMILFTIAFVIIECMALCYLRENLNVNKENMLSSKLMRSEVSTATQAFQNGWNEALSKMKVEINHASYEKGYLDACKSKDKKI